MSRVARAERASWDDEQMRVALISDIHGNTVALDAVLEDVARRDIDLILCLGDLAAFGPDPAGAVERIAELSCLTAVGNTDLDMTNVPDWWDDPAAVGAPAPTERVVAINRWCATQLSADHMGFLAGLPTTVEVDLGVAGRLLGFHGSQWTPRPDWTVPTVLPKGWDRVKGLSG